MSFYSPHKSIDIGVELGESTIFKITDRAILFSIDDEKYWVPISQICDDCYSEEWVVGDNVNLYITTWFAKQKGLWIDVR